MRIYNDPGTLLLIPIVIMIYDTMRLVTLAKRLNSDNDTLLVWHSFIQTSFEPEQHIVLRRTFVVTAPCGFVNYAITAALPVRRSPMMRPNRPMILLNTSTIRTLTKSSGFAASAKAAFAPVIPTAIPQRRLHTPTVRPAKKIAWPV